MKLITLLSLFLLAALTCVAQPREERRFGVPMMLGPVRSVRIERTEMIEQNGVLVEGPRQLVQSFNYNEDGTQKEITNYGSGGAVLNRVIETYAADGKMLEAVNFDSSGNQRSRTVYKYDESRRQLENVTYRSDGSVAVRITFTYEGNKRLHEAVNYDANGIVIAKVTGTLDLTTHLMQTVTQTPTQTIQRESTFTTTPNGQTHEEKVDGVPVRRIQTTNTPGRGPEMTEFNPDGSVQSKFRSQGEFDAHRNMVKSVSLKEGPDGKFQSAMVLYRTIEYYEKKVTSP